MNNRIIAISEIKRTQSNGTPKRVLISNSTGTTKSGMRPDDWSSGDVEVK